MKCRCAESKIKQIQNILPDSFSDSKDWKSGGIVERIEWLKFFVGHYKEELNRLEDIIEYLQSKDDD